jgi:hypothetical protein
MLSDSHFDEIQNSEQNNKGNQCCKRQTNQESRCLRGLKDSLAQKLRQNA